MVFKVRGSSDWTIGSAFGVHVVGKMERQGVGGRKCSLQIPIPVEEKALVAGSDLVVMVIQNHLRGSLG